MKKTILSIETSCDETALALVKASGGIKAPKFKILREVVLSQIPVHRPWGGVVPNLAKREHEKNLPILLKKLLNSSAKGRSSLGGKFYILNSIDLIAVTVGPGLEPALWAGITFAEELGKKYGKPVVGANHLEGHLYSFLLFQKKAVNSKFPISNSKTFPAVALIVSGGHTLLLKVADLAHWKKLGETRDDAVGEAFDKVARLLGLPYPGGPELSKLARKGNPQAIPFPQPMANTKDFDFSFSGLKTAVLYHLRDANIRIRANDANHANIADVAASFEHAAVNVLVKKTMRAARKSSARSVLLSGGVAANARLRHALSRECKKSGLSFFVAPKKYNTDNAVMIAAAAYMAGLRKKSFPLRANGNLSI